MSNSHLLKITNTSERYTFRAMEAGFSGTDYLIFPKLPIRDVLALGNIPKPLKNTLNTSHFDFVVVSSDHVAKFAVEFDGPHHSQYLETRKSDIRKNKLCAIAELPLLRVNDVELEMLESISILEFMIRQLVAWEHRYPSLSAEIQDQITAMSPEELNQIAEDGVLLDPQFRFDLEHPFPLTTSTRSLLNSRYGMVENTPECNSKRLWYQVSPGADTIGGSACRHIQGAHYGIYRGRGESASTTWHDGRLSTKGIEILHESSVSVGLPWFLVIEEDYDDNKESPFEYFSRTGRMPVYCPILPGIHIPSICEAVSEYLCLRDILQWAEAHLQ